MVNWDIVYAKQAMKDAKKLAASGLKAKAQELLAVLANDPLQNPPPFEKLVGDLSLAGSISSIEWCMKSSSKKKSFGSYVCGRIMSELPA